MKQLQPVLWTKGTILTPQHLQLQERFLEDSLNFRLQALKFCAWGFSEIVLDQELLTEGQLAVSRASGIFPDGLLFEIPGSDQPPPSKALAEFFDPGVRALDIYLTVPDYKQKGLNVAGLGRTAGSRFLAEIASVRDDNTGSGERPIQIARKNLRLLAANETREGSSALRIANVESPRSSRFGPATICAAWSAGFSRFSPPKVPSSLAAAARRTRAWPTLLRRTSPASGCFIPSTRISPCSATCCRASAVILKSFSLN